MLRRTSDNRFGQPNVYGGYLVKHRLASQQDLDDFCANRYCLGAGQGTPYCVASCKEQSFAQLGLDTEKAYNWPCEYMCQQRIYGDTEDMNIMIRSIDNPDPLVHF
ncbi:MAG: hypothetical protein LBH81_02490 [Rickettsiales bacterium]|nr:hypothetical protein [Rickettsiales bacterium]